MSDVINPEDQKDTKLKAKKIIYLGLIATVVIVVIYAVAVSLTTSSVTSSRSNLSTQYTGVENGGPLVGKKAPDFTLSAVSSSSSTLDLAQFEGRPLVLNFFASWCVPCKTELPYFASISKTDSGKVRFVGVDENDTRGPGMAIIRKTGVTYPTMFDGNTKLVVPYHLIGLPTTLFINSKGVVVEEIAGQISQTTLKNGISKIINK